MNLEMSIQKAERDLEEYKQNCEELKRQQGKMNEVMDLHASDLDIKVQLYNAQE